MNLDTEDKVTTFISQLSADGGGDGPEAGCFLLNFNFYIYSDGRLNGCS